MSEVSVERQDVRVWQRAAMAFLQIQNELQFLILPTHWASLVLVVDQPRAARMNEEPLSCFPLFLSLQ